MAVRASLKAIVLAMLSVSGLAAFSSTAFAQQWDQWDGSGRSGPREYPQYDGDDAPYGSDRDYGDREGPRADNRYYDPDSDPRRYDPRYNGDHYEGPQYPGPRVYGRGRGGGEPQYGDRDDYGAWDAAPSEEEESRLSRSEGRSGGERPYIRAVAPPVVEFNAPYAPGSVIIDTSARKLYYVLTGNSAYAYSIAVGRQGFAWTGKEKVARISDWPDWYPPSEMRRRQPYLPERMLGGIRNPLGAKAIYLGNTLYRIHGTNDPKSIGKAESSGCFRMLNENVLHLASLVHVGTDVTIVRSLGGNVASVGRSAEPGGRETRVAPSPPRERRYPRDDDLYEGWH